MFQNKSCWIRQSCGHAWGGANGKQLEVAPMALLRQRAGGKQLLWLTLRQVGLSQNLAVATFCQWEFQDPRMEVLYHILGVYPLNHSPEI